MYAQNLRFRVVTLEECLQTSVSSVGRHLFSLPGVEEKQVSIRKRKQVSWTLSSVYEKHRSTEGVAEEEMVRRGKVDGMVVNVDVLVISR